MTSSWLDHIDSPADLRKLSLEQLPELASEIRQFIIDIIAIKEGHLGASLGVVELTIALHYVFQTPEDLLVWDVGHQAYGHKILTGRKNAFHSNRQLGGLSGFPKRSESPYDTFGVGHSSTAISAALGMALASALDGHHERQHIAVVGDASIASGMAFEALNHAGVTQTNLLVILNDNAIGIDPSVGALKEYLTKRALPEAINDQDNLFEALSFHYTGPIDGHDTTQLIHHLTQLKTISGPKVLHVVTKKGKGLPLAEAHQVTYHAPGKFDPKTGELIAKPTGAMPPKFQDVFGHTLVELAQHNASIIGITPAMPTGSSLRYMMDAFPDRAIDVGIAEQHAVTLAGGLATQGKIVFCAIYATFFQRAYDQLIHDICLQNLPVIFCLDRAGLVGEDGATHHGVFDLSSLRTIPNLIIFAPRNEMELRHIMYSVQVSPTGPIAIRYPRGRGSNIQWQVPFERITIGQNIELKHGTDVAILSIGPAAHVVNQAIAEIADIDRIGHYDWRFLKPVDRNLLHTICRSYRAIITVEDGALIGGLGSSIAEFMAQEDYHNQLVCLGVPDVFVPHGTIAELKDMCGFDRAHIVAALKKLL
ncbi:MAG: 1-deoxy-D-xylulose-5-phosphate synthase [Cryomorphaceae bacterium BACL21 MAG-121220-bin10]|jgi:1-deoxy-D-xylulose-5-phosphate synthase|nr:MAG: 1-deoxy-D-xylulose-5-phosphate synthase [Cryomorphaceae bacterium BACL21 MAG-121220-bin10]